MSTIQLSSLSKETQKIILADLVQQEVLANEQFFDNYDDVRDWLKKYKVQGVSIDPHTLVVNTSVGVYLSDFKLKELPVQFGTVRGDFACDNNKLTSLRGCPNLVEGSFNCSNNPLADLDYLPKHIYGLLEIPARLRNKYTDEQIRSVSRIGSAIIPLEKQGFFKTLFAAEAAREKKRIARFKKLSPETRAQILKDLATQGRK